MNRLILVFTVIGVAALQWPAFATGAEPSDQQRKASERFAKKLLARPSPAQPVSQEKMQAALHRHALNPVVQAKALAALQEEALCKKVHPADYCERISIRKTAEEPEIKELLKEVGGEALLETVEFAIEVDALETD